MKFGAFLLSLVPAVALAQPATELSPQEQAMQQTIIQLTGEKIQAQTQAITFQRQVQELQKQLAATKKPSDPTPPKP